MQSRRHSLEEVIVGTVIGFVGSMIINYVLIPVLFGVKASVGQSFLFVAVFTIWSIVRGYFVRRHYNRKAMK